jgi:hypothetical protein
LGKQLKVSEVMLVLEGKRWVCELFEKGGVFGGVFEQGGGGHREV